MHLSQNLVQCHGDTVTDRVRMEIGDQKSAFTSVLLSDRLACIRSTSAQRCLWILLKATLKTKYYLPFFGLKLDYKETRVAWTKTNQKLANKLAWHSVYVQLCYTVLHHIKKHENPNHSKFWTSCMSNKIF